MNRYDYQHGISKFDQKRGQVPLCNFTARITRERRFHDDRKTRTILTVQGERWNYGESTELPPVTIDAADFPSMGWVANQWGSKAIIFPESAAEREIAVAIKLCSDATAEDVYTHTGWATVDQRDAYLTTAGAITAKGYDPSVQVELPPDLKHYALPAPPKKPAEHIAKSLQLTQLMPPVIAWPLFLAAYRPILQTTDYAIHVSGKTGTYKSELASLVQSHYGQAMDARNLPGSWSSTPNAMEALAYRAKDALFTLDDFVPYGTSWQVRQYQKAADQLIRGQGNQAGRARLTDTSSMQTTFFPRGMILSTGEDIPEGHSVRGRTLILELSPGDIDRENLTTAQLNRHHYPAALAAFVQWVANRQPHRLHDELIAARNEIRKELNDIGHARTPTIIADLIATANIVIAWLLETHTITNADATRLQNDAELALLEAGHQQSIHLMTADPCEAFREAILQVVGLHQAHFRTINGGIPKKPELLGWTEEASTGEIPTYRHHGPKLGWVDWDNDEMLIDMTTAYATIKRHSGGRITLTQPTMLKRLKDAGMLVRVNATQQRNTVRVRCEGHPRTVIALSLSQTLNTSEKP